MRALHTPPAPIDLGRLVPGLEHYARSAVRLHPRPGRPGPAESSIGGPPRWPRDEPWPFCPGSGPGDHLFDDAPREPVPLVSVLQLYAADVPGLPFPDGTDLLQVLWCPFDHDPYSAPRPQLFWRAAATIDAVMAPPPSPAGPARTVPVPCTLAPEVVREYPNWEVPKSLRANIDAALRGTPWTYHYHLSTAPGAKAGGYPYWCQLPEWPSCPACGTTMHHLATVPSWEFGPGEASCWMPVEDQAALAGEPDDGSPLVRAVRSPTGLELGDLGQIYLFVCSACPSRPFEYVFQN